MLVLLLQHTRTMMGPYIDIPGPEISAGSRMMSWLFDEYSKYKRFSPACVTGKVRASRQMTHCSLMLWKASNRLCLTVITLKHATAAMCLRLSECHQHMKLSNKDCVD